MTTSDPTPALPAGPCCKVMEQSRNSWRGIAREANALLSQDRKYITTLEAERDTLARDLAAARAERDALAEALRALIASAEGREEAFVMAGDAGNFEGILDHLISAVVTDNEAWNKARAALARLDSEGKP